MGEIIGSALGVGSIAAYTALFLPHTRKWVKNPRRAVGLAGLMALIAGPLTVFAVLVLLDALRGFLK